MSWEKRDSFLTFESGLVKSFDGLFLIETEDERITVNRRKVNHRDRDELEK